MSDLELYRQDRFPIFQNRMYDSRDEAIGCPRGEIHIVQDRGTGLVRNAAFDPALMHYDSAYQNEQGYSSVFVDHLNAVADLVLEKLGRETLVEVGCGKATFLNMLRARGAEVIGFDPAYEGDDPTIVREYFSEELGFQGKGLILRHVLEHIPDPVAFLRRLASANGSQGLIYIEVPCLDWIIKNRAWFDFFYEHVNYFRLGDFQRIFGQVLHASRSFGGQYLSIVADLASIRAPVFDPTQTVHLPEDFFAVANSSAANSSAYDDGRPCVIWGGASKGVIFSLLRERSGLPVSRVIDISPAKQGKYLPATGLKVESPAQVLPDLASGSVIYVMNPNYLPEIRRISGPEFDYRSVHD